MPSWQYVSRTVFSNRIRGETHRAVGLHPIARSRLTVEQIVQVFLHFRVEVCAGPALMLHRDEEGFRGVLVQPGVETEEYIFEGSRRRQKSSRYFLGVRMIEKVKGNIWSLTVPKSYQKREIQERR